ncbi:N,N-dimethylformamidase beta subunit family domain-containing protein [Patulibacter sp. SYSU D01012]|uniref:N,N-dimethylformamidase beta subunit family domain-containing protein n=1 Tax=Patulibacter sp. SYSU D01012 TaxID=2817381 RepID=UPI001B30CC1B|nr:N,N-dimethylformamidase beta subunit family domain-containing protein [Patulibacter sp. SYSU D01012]
MTRAARIVFLLLVVATAASFFVAQRLKNQPAVFQGVYYSPVLSPNGDGRYERLKLRFRIKRSTPVTVEVVNTDNEAVATLARDRPAQKYKRIALEWDGRNDDGRLVKDGRYRIKFTLPEEGRSVVWQKASFAVQTAPPEPRVRRIVGIPPRRTTALLPSVGGDPVEAVVTLRGWEPSARVVRTGPGTPRVVRTLAVEDVARPSTGTRLRDPRDGKRYRRADAGRVRWDGKTDDGRPAPDGTYVIQVCVRNRAGVLGCGPRASGKDGLPAPDEDGRGRLRGNGGVTVRRLGVQPSPVPVKAGNRIGFYVDSRGAAYDWTLRRVGTRRPVASGRSRKPALKVSPRSSRAGVYRLTVTANGRRVTVPALAGDARRQSVLVVLPGITWQGLNAVDDDGDGLANTLTGAETSRASRIRSERVMAGLPAGFDAAVQPAIEWLVRHRKRFEVTTDLALAQGRGPKLDGHKGVLLVGEARWTTPQNGEALRAYVRRGGVVAGLDPSGLRRGVELAQDGGQLREPGPFEATNALGVRSKGAVRLDGPPQNDKDDIGLFDGTDGRFDGYPVGWPAEGVEGGQAVATAVDRRDHVIIAAYKIGDGFLIRTGLPTFAGRLARDADTSDLMESAWRRLSR